MLCLFAGTAIIALFVSAAWARAPRRSELLFWALAYWLGAAGIFLVALRAIAPDWLALGIGNMLVVTCTPLFWFGLRRFDGRACAWSLLLPAPLLWAGTYFLLPQWSADINNRIIVASVLIAGYSLLTAWDSWRGHRIEPLEARGWMTMFFATHGLVFLARIPFSILSPVEMVNGVPVSLWYGIFSFELFVHSLLSGFSIFVLIRERAERHFRRAAEIDPLTGIYNRRAFISYVDERRQKMKGEGALALLDIDHFKRINDTFGHAGGDEALTAFCAVVRKNMSDDMIFGRIGGEEFALYLPDLELEQARQFCEDLRLAVEAAVIPLGEQSLRMTVSMGLSADPATYADINFLLGIADRGLYISKRNGRNRVTALNASAGLKLIASLMAGQRGANRDALKRS